MNQILSTESYSDQNRPQEIPQRVSRKESFQHNSRKSTLDMRMIIIIFSILAIVFALIIIGAKLFGMARNKNKNDDSPVADLNKPQITIERQNDMCVLKVNYEEGISKVSFWWNEDSVTEINYNSLSDFFVKNIEIPEGENNILHVKAIGSNNSISEIEKNISETTEVGIPEGDKPVIEWKFNPETTEIIITARSEKGIVDLSYKWEGEEVKTIKNDTEGQKEIQAVEKARMGIHKLYITATDSEGNTARNKDDTFIGVLEPEIAVDILVDQYNDRIGIKVTAEHNSGFKKIIIKMTGYEDLVIDENTPGHDPSYTSIEDLEWFDPEAVVELEVVIYTREMPEEAQIKKQTIDLKEYRS